MVDHSNMTFEQVRREYSNMSLEELQEEYFNVRKMGGYPKLYRELHKNMKRYRKSIPACYRYEDVLLVLELTITIIGTVSILIACLMLVI